jgi:hypothetical protein
MGSTVPERGDVIVAPGAAEATTITVLESS